MNKQQQQKQDIYLMEENENKVKKSRQFWKVMDDYPELSLGPPFSQVVASHSMSCPSSESETDSSRKRKYFWDHIKNEPSLIQTGLELQLKDPLPLGWEQCLDLESGRKFYLNRKTLKTSSKWPKEEKLNLELNMSTLTSCDGTSINSEMLVGSKKRNSLSSNNMFAVACSNCHLLVMLCKSSPSCPNCKYLNPPPTQQNPPPETVKSLNTLSLLN